MDRSCFGYIENIIAELIHTVVPGGAATRHPKGFDQAALAKHYYGEPHVSAIENQRRLSRNFSKNHWTAQRDKDVEKYLEGRRALDKSAAQSKKRTA